MPHQVLEHALHLTPISPSANVRQIHGRKGEVWTPESAADKIAIDA